MPTLTNQNSEVVGTYVSPEKSVAQGVAKKWRKSMRFKYGKAGTQVRIFSKDVKTGGTVVSIHVVIARVADETLRLWENGEVGRGWPRK